LRTGGVFEYFFSVQLVRHELPHFVEAKLSG